MSCTSSPYRITTGGSWPGEAGGPCRRAGVSPSLTSAPPDGRHWLASAPAPGASRPLLTQSLLWKSLGLRGHWLLSASTAHLCGGPLLAGWRPDTQAVWALHSRLCQQRLKNLQQPTPPPTPLPHSSRTSSAPAGLHSRSGLPSSSESFSECLPHARRVPGSGADGLGPSPWKHGLRQVQGLHV